MIAVSLFLFAYGDGTGQPVLWLSPPTIRILPNATGPGKDNARSVNLAAQLGEAESVQVGLRLTQPTALESITVSPLPPGVSVDIFKVIAVYCNRSAIYGLDGDRWIPDVLYPMSDLIESGAVALEPDIAHSFWIKFTIACNATPGSYNATATLELVGGPPLVMPVAVTIWPLTVPKLESTAAIGTVFSFRTDIMAAHYGNHGIFPAESAMKWFDGLAAQRIPGDTPYVLFNAFWSDIAAGCRMSTHPLWHCWCVRPWAGTSIRSVRQFLRRGQSGEIFPRTRCWLRAGLGA